MGDDVCFAARVRTASCEILVSYLTVRVSREDSLEITRLPGGEFAAWKPPLFSLLGLSGAGLPGDTMAQRRRPTLRILYSAFSARYSGVLATFRVESLNQERTQLESRKAGM